MIKILDRKWNNVIALEISGLVTEHDFDNIVPLINERFEKHGQDRMYCEFRDFEEVEGGALWKDLEFAERHYSEFEKLAIVGDKKWMDWMSKFATPFTGATVEYFDISEKENAWNWIKEEVTYEA